MTIRMTAREFLERLFYFTGGVGLGIYLARHLLP